MVTITINGDGIDLEYVEISDESAKRFIESGISEEELYGLWETGDSSTESGVIEGSVLVDGVSRSSFSLSAYPDTKPHQIDDVSAPSWYFIKEEAQRGDFITIKTEDTFEQTILR